MATLDKEAHHMSSECKINVIYEAAIVVSLIWSAIFEVVKHFLNTFMNLLSMWFNFFNFCFDFYFSLSHVYLNL